MTTTRVLAFDGLHNFRDYGDYPVQGGGRIRSGWLYRSAQHKEATPADLERVHELGLAAVIDLRGDKERAQYPCPRPQGFTAKVVFIPDDTVTAAPHIMAARGVTDPQSAAAHMTAGYAEMPFRPAFMQAMNQYYQALADLDGPSLIHCMAGKDRTGIAVAVLHRTLGVEREHWLADYMLTNQTGNVDARIAAGARHVRANFGETLDDATVRVLMTVRPEFIDTCFAVMDERHGGVPGYLTACGISERKVERVRERLIV